MLCSDFDRLVEFALGDGSSARRVHPARSNSEKTLQHGELGDGPAAHLWGHIAECAMLFVPLWRGAKSRQKAGRAPKKGSCK